MSPKILRLCRRFSRRSRYYLMRGKNLENKITEFRSPKKWRNLVRLQHPSAPKGCRILKYQRRSLLGITCSMRQDQTWQRKNFISNFLISALVDYNDKRQSKDWHCRTHNTDLLNQDENKFDQKKNWRNSLGECNNDGEMRVQGLRENHETIQQFTSIVEIFKMWNRVIVKDCLTCPVNRQLNQVLVVW